MLKAILSKDAHGALAPELQSEYKAGAEDLAGMFVLDVESCSLDGGATYSLENVSGLKSALSSEREASKKYKKIAENFEGLDATEVKAALKKVDEIKGWDSDKKVQETIAAREKQLTEKHTKEMMTEKEAVKKYKSQLEKSLVDNEAIKALNEHKGSVNLLLPHIRSFTRITEKDGQLGVEVVGRDGIPRISTKSGSTDQMSISELVAELKTDKEFSRAFEGTNASGSGSVGGVGGGKGGLFAISAADAKSPSKYQAAKAEAEKAGQPLSIIE